MSLIDWFNLAGWAVIWAWVVGVLLLVFYLGFYERRFGRPGHLHRFLLLVAIGPFGWLLVAWYFTEDGFTGQHNQDPQQGEGNG